MQTDTARRAGRTAVIIPAFNEAEVLPGVLAELAATRDDLDVVVVDDGSKDATAEAARAAGVVCLQLPFNLGIGGALRTGFRYAVDRGYERAIQFDADGQHDPSRIETLLAGLDAGADMVIGNRFGDAEAGYEVGRSRGAAMALLRWAIRRLSGKRFTDTSSGFRAFSRPVLEYFAVDYPVEYMDSVEALVMACRSGFRVDEVPTRMRPRAGGQPSNRRFRLAYHYLRLLIVLISSPRRIAPARPA